MPIDVLNVKAPKEKINDLHRIPGIYPAYHMNKSTWISIWLDKKIQDDMIFSLLEDSLHLTISKSK